MPVWPTSPLPEIRPAAILSRDGDNHEQYSSTTHTGTHIDAPYHFVEGGQTVDALPLETLVGTGYCIDVRGNLLVDRRAVQEQWDGAMDRSIVLFRTGWSTKRSFSREFLYSFPGLSMDAAKFLLEHGVKMVGIDTLSIDPYGVYDVHRLLLGEAVPIIEDLALEELECGRAYTIIALPLRIQGASGSMARVIAVDGRV